MEYNCKNCGNLFDDALGTCPACGAPVVVESKAADPQPQAQPDVASQQPYQQQPYQRQAYQQPYQQQAYQQQPYQQQGYQQQPYQQPGYYPTMSNQPKSRLVAGLLGILLGGLGIHNFYLGFTSKAVIQIVVSFLTCGLGGIWGFIEGIMIFVGSINADANGIPLGE